MVYAVNGSITRQIRSEIQRLSAEDKNVKLFMIGRKSADSLNKEFSDIFYDRLEGLGNSVNYNAAAVLQKNYSSL